MKRKRLLCPFLALLMLFSTSKLLTLAGEYTAAVYEHKTFFEAGYHTRSQALRVMQKNLEVFQNVSRLAKEKGADIIVFPEDGIYGFLFENRDEIFNYLEDIPDPSSLEKKWNPCTEPDRFPNTEVLKQLSCIARNSSIALVANMGDVKFCKKSDLHCPHDGRYQYNTDVAFDTDGTLLARYHKQHLFSKYEQQFNSPLKAERVTFNTSFGVTFGVFTCFDIIFYDPAMALVEKLGIRNVVFTTAWVGGLPTLSSIGFQQAWSRATSVNLLASNQHNPSKAMTGSGIYSKGDPLQYVYDETSSKKHLLVTRVQDKDSQLEINQEQPKEATLYDCQIQETFTSTVRRDSYTFSKLSGANGNVCVCSNDLCCQANYSTVSEKAFETEMFAFGAFSGHHKKKTGYYIQACILIKCDNMEKQSCGNVLNTTSSTLFKKLSIAGNFSSKTYVFPEVLLSNMLLTAGNETKYFGNKLVADELDRPLFSAILFGRTFALDPPIGHRVASTMTSANHEDNSLIIGVSVAAGVIGLIAIILVIYYRENIKSTCFHSIQRVKRDGYSTV